MAKAYTHAKDVFVIDNAYIVDFDNNVEFFLSAVVYGNKNGIINETNYEKV